MVAEGLSLILEEPRRKGYRQRPIYGMSKYTEFINQADRLLSKNTVYLPAVTNVFKTTWKARFESQALGFSCDFCFHLLYPPRELSHTLRDLAYTYADSPTSSTCREEPPLGSPSGLLVNCAKVHPQRRMVPEKRTALLWKWH